MTRQVTAKPGSVWWKEWLAKSAPWVFISGLLILLSALLQYALSDVDGGALAPGSSVQDYAYHCLAAMNQVSGWLLLGVALACVAAAALLPWRVDINLFALYYFYRSGWCAAIWALRASLSVRRSRLRLRPG